MHWKESSAIDERLRFVQDAYRGTCSMAERCERYGMSRTTGYRVLADYAEAGPAGLGDGSHRPHTCPHATPHGVVRLILDLRQRYTWEARKVRRLLQRQAPALVLPSIAMVHRILARQ